jgi:hypothetical protein
MAAPGVRSFNITTDELNSGERWRARKSGTSHFETRDFVADEVKPGYGFGPIFLVLALGVLTSFIIFYGPQLTRDEPLIAIGDRRVSIDLLIGSALVVAYALLASVMLFLLGRRQRLDWVGADKWRYVCPGWSDCIFTFGSRGICVDGTYFQHYLEWDTVSFVRETASKPDKSGKPGKSAKLELQNAAGQLLVIPQRFFEGGGDLSWNEVKDRVKTGAPSAKWF